MDAPFSYNQIPCEQLWRAVIHLMVGVASELRPLMAEHGLTGPQWANLRTLAQAGPDGLRLSDISKQLHQTEGNITGVIDRLVESGLVERQSHPEDRRVIIAQLTPEGWEVVQQVAPLFHQRLTELFSPLSEAQQIALTETLSELTPPGSLTGPGCCGKDHAAPETGK